MQRTWLLIKIQMWFYFHKKRCDGKKIINKVSVKLVVYLVCETISETKSTRLCATIVSAKYQANRYKKLRGASKRV